MKKVVLAFATAAALVLTGGCKHDEAPAADPAASVPHVAVNTLKWQEINVEMTLPGRVTALKTAQIRPQVGGIVTKRLFTQGSDVEAGQPLFQIDPAPFSADVEMAEAALARAEASYRQLYLRAQRLGKLVKTGAVSQQDYDDARANTAQAAATVAEARALLNRKKLDLAYSTVRAPVSGRIDEQYVTEGALVSASDPQAMAIVQQTHSVYVDARIPASQIRNMLAATVKPSAENTIREVTLLDDAGNAYDVKPELLFSGTRVNEDTGDVVLRAEVKNPQRQLLPGMYVRLKVSQRISDRGIAIPEQAIQHQENKHVVWLIDDEDKARKVEIFTGDMTAGGQFIKKGLSAGQKLVIEGQDKLHDGIQVRTAPWKKI